MKKGNEKAIEAIYTRWSDALYGVIFNICKREDIAKDVLQDTLIKVWEKKSSYDPKKAKLFTWIYQIARNKSIDAIRSRQNQTKDKIQGIHSFVSPLNSESMVRKSELLDKISSLEPKYQEVLTGLYFHGFTQKEWSQKCDLPLGTVKSRLRIALQKLRHQYTEPVSIFSLLMFLGNGG